MEDVLEIGGEKFRSRLLLGTGKFANPAIMIEAIQASGAQLITIAVRRFNLKRPFDDLYTPLASLKGIQIVPNTSGALNATEAVRAALLGRELTGSRFVKLEIHPNPHHLMPDPLETYEAARRLVAEGFIVLPYMPADPVLAKHLEEIGCAAVMPLGAAIGSGRGLTTEEMVRMMVRECTVPVIVDAGLRAPSEAARAMELGCGAVLVNSAVSAAGNPPAMAAAFAGAVRAGRQARLAGLMSRTSGQAVASSPLTAFLDDSESAAPPLADLKEVRP